MFAKLNASSISSMVNVNFDNNRIMIRVSKFGTSNMVFEQNTDEQQLYFVLTEEKIAALHQTFKPMIMKELSGIIESVGGKIIA
jgi:hypothetical protein